MPFYKSVREILDKSNEAQPGQPPRGQVLDAKLKRNHLKTCAQRANIQERYNIQQPNLQAN